MNRVSFGNGGWVRQKGGMTRVEFGEVSVGKGMLVELW
jgi:hypothetical protein